jgi:hypothetical protein
MKKYNKNLSAEDQKMKHYLQMEKMKSYLLDTNIDNKIQKANSNSNALGFILSFSTKIKHKKDSHSLSSNAMGAAPAVGTFQNEDIFISLLLFLSIRTGRVERYLINTSNPTLGGNETGIDFKPDLFYFWNKNQYKIDHDLDYYLDKNFTTQAIVGDGKLTTKFYSYFVSELLRDYFIDFNSYRDGNIATLRKLTSPTHYLTVKNNENTSEISTSSVLKESEKESASESESESEFANKKPKMGIGLGSGVLNKEELQLIHDSTTYKLKDFDTLKTHKFKIFKNSPKLTSEQRVIFAPKTLKNKTLENFFEHRCNIKLIYANKSELSQIVKDLTRTLSIKTVDSPKTISHRIKTFNYHIVKNLTKMENKYKIKSPFDTD